MPKKKPDETPADAVPLDAERLPEIGATITAYETPWHTVSGKVTEHLAHGWDSAFAGPGVSISCTSAEREVDQRVVGDRLFIPYGTKYTLHG